MVLAHETWFLSQHPTEDWGFATSGASIALLAGAVAITLAVRLVSYWWNGFDIRSSRGSRNDAVRAAHASRGLRTRFG